MSFFEKLKKGLSKTKSSIFGQVNNLFKAFKRVDEDLIEELEELLIAADVGFESTEEIDAVINIRKSFCFVWVFGFFK